MGGFQPIAAYSSSIFLSHALRKQILDLFTLKAYSTDWENI